MTIQITSSAFEDGAMIPRSYTCDDTDVSPDLAWTGVPEGTKTLALICDDPVSPGGMLNSTQCTQVPGTETTISEDWATEVSTLGGRCFLL